MRRVGGRRGGVYRTQLYVLKKKRARGTNDVLRASRSWGSICFVNPSILTKLHHHLGRYAMMSFRHVGGAIWFVKQTSPPPPFLSCRTPPLLPIVSVIKEEKNKLQNDSLPPTTRSLWGVVQTIRVVRKHRIWKGNVFFEFLQHLPSRLLRHERE